MSLNMKNGIDYMLSEISESPKGTSFGQSESTGPISIPVETEGAISIIE